MINSATQSTNSTSATAAATAAQSAANSQIDMNGFLTMFTTQLQYQDPTNPLQSYQLASQLAQFSSVGQLTEMNSNLKAAQTTLNSIYNNQSVQLLGKQVTGSGNTLQLTDGKSSKGFYELSQAADVTVKITDSQGNTLRTIDLGNQAAGTHTINWDGLNDDGSSAGNGTYHFTVEATDSSGNAVTTASSITGTCSGVRTENGATTLILNNDDQLTLPATSVTAVQNEAASA